VFVCEPFFYLFFGALLFSFENSGIADRVSFSPRGSHSLVVSRTLSLVRTVLWCPRDVRLFALFLILLGSSKFFLRKQGTLTSLEPGLRFNPTCTPLPFLGLRPPFCFRPHTISRSVTFLLFSFFVAFFLFSSMASPSRSSFFFASPLPPAPPPDQTLGTASPLKPLSNDAPFFFSTKQMVSCFLGT